MLHHVEVYVSELERSVAFWKPFLNHLGTQAERWHRGALCCEDPDRIKVEVVAPSQA